MPCSLDENTDPNPSEAGFMSIKRQGGGNTLRFEDFGCVRRMSRDVIGMTSWCSGSGGPEETGRCGVPPLERVAAHEVAAKGKAFPFKIESTEDFGRRLKRELMGLIARKEVLLMEKEKDRYVRTFAEMTRLAS